VAIDLESMSADDAEFARREVRLKCDEWQKKADAFGMMLSRTVTRKPSKPRGEPNALERDFASRIRFPYTYEAITFHLSPSVSYRPDWVIHHHPLICVEVKLDTTGRDPRMRSRLATQNRESLTKLKLCACKYRSIEWYVAKRGKDGVWKLFAVTVKGISRTPTAVEWMV